MHRPFFSLAILLEIIAVSLFLVGSAQSQTGVPTFDVASSTAHGCGWLWHGTSGQQIRRNFFEVVQAIQSRSYVSRNAEGNDNLPWNLADDAVVSPAIVSTGYDAAYDFAMFEGQYYDLAPSQIEIESMATAVVESESEVVPVFAISCPASSPYYDDFNCCLDSGFDRRSNENAQANENAGEIAWGVCEADGILESSDCLTAVEAQHAWQHIHVAIKRTIESALTLWQSYRVPFAQSGNQSLSDTDAQLAWEQIKGAATRTIEVLEIAVDSSWQPFSHLSLVIAAKNLPNISIDTFVSQKPALPVASTISLTEGQQIVILTQAAVTLDEIGLYLQEAAQRLRYIAADRIVSKSNSRRIAREGNY